MKLMRSDLIGDSLVGYCVGDGDKHLGKVVSCAVPTWLTFPENLFIIYVKKSVINFGRKVITTQPQYSKYKCHTNVLYLHRCYL